ncbi:probable archaetidylserine synthase [Natronomonas moolapensis 8.8.11]|uniref:Probable archaetidylserine synthase n=1 Tax=Natronomonas moolapensis (strain DSM 18674 / CECT 7526 / JCM 14361 / 8.8.11) TaxID=268739 RepID=M1Y0Q5_NATM8|nr:protein sorting system archaetidylserine synthase [Natronomonas moolapensis]CCQ36055.1 probable archaetidylserine synthase [Natronomonas moolapensis 8.8.11]
MQPRFLGRLGVADTVTATNAAIGFAAVATATVDPSLAARLILLAAIADGLDGVVARRLGGTDVGPLLDSLADVASFGVAPAALVYAVATDGGAAGSTTPLALAALVASGLYVAMAVVRLAIYTLEDSDRAETVGVQTTLSATLLSVAYLAGVGEPAALIALVAACSYLMVAPVSYPDLYARDAIVLGGLQALVIAFPVAFNRVLPRSLLVFAVGYLVLAPVAYWREP